MSLAINIDKVRRVLLADGWHTVKDDSFAMDAYEFLWYPNEDTTIMDAQIVHGGGQSGICATGFTFKEISARDRAYVDSEIWISGPVTAIQAVETRK